MGTANPGNEEGITNAAASDAKVPDNYQICDVSGFRVPVKDAFPQNWAGVQSRMKDYDPRQPQDFVRGVPEQQEGSSRPEQADVFITTPVLASDL